MKRVYIARGVAEAHLVRGFLAAEGIDAIVQGESLSTVFGGIPIDRDSLPSVWVTDDADYDRALRLVEETSRSHTEKQAEPGEPEPAEWECAACGETVPPESDVCWSCGEVRD